MRIFFLYVLLNLKPNARHTKIYKKATTILSVLVLLLALPNMITAQDPETLCTAIITCNDCMVTTRVFDNNTYSQMISCNGDHTFITGTGAYCGTVCGLSACNSEVCEA